ARSRSSSSKAHRSDDQRKGSKNIVGAEVEVRHSSSASSTSGHSRKNSETTNIQPHPPLGVDSVISQNSTSDT
ncbi:unnamed protein product, partial [Amoebophrya sp. A25]